MRGVGQRQGCLFCAGEKCFQMSYMAGLGTLLQSLPSGYLLHSHGTWPIYRWFTYVLKIVIFIGYVK